MTDIAYFADPAEDRNITFPAHFAAYSCRCFHGLPFPTFPHLSFGPPLPLSTGHHVHLALEEGSLLLGTPLTSPSTMDVFKGSALHDVYHYHCCITTKVQGLQKAH